jgi:hypothetical protein
MILRSCSWMLLVGGVAVAAPQVRESNIRIDRLSSPTLQEEQFVIRRSRVTLRSQAETRDRPRLTQDEADLERLRTVKITEKTRELVSQLEGLVARPGQQTRIGELKMRLAELYFEQAEGEAALEALAWENAVAEFEKKSDSNRARPVLKTPRADAVRRKALRLYAELEQQSRGRDQGRSRQIDRNELLYFYGRTLADLGRRKDAIRFLSEHVSRAKPGSRLASARLSLADLLFDERRFRQAIPHYLETAAGRGMDSEMARNIKPYALYKLAWSYINSDQHEKSVLALLRTIEASQDSSSRRRVAFEQEARRDLTRAFVLAGQTSQGEAFFSKLDQADLMESFREFAAETARDRRQFREAKNWYEKLINTSPKVERARAWGLEILEISLKSEASVAQVEALDSFVKRFGPKSDWFEDQEISDDERQLLTAETATLLRREAKTRHRAGQLRKNLSLFREAKPFYEVYFRWVPDSVPDLESRLHEMRFFYAELLFRLEDWQQAAKAYEKVGAGRYGAEAGYARIVALKQAAAKDPSARDEFVEAVEDFVSAQPQDPRSADLLYSSAEEAFRSGSADSSMNALLQLVNRAPRSPRAREAAERVLFLLEKESKWDEIQSQIRSFQSNRELTQAAGPAFESKLLDIAARASFKKVEALPETTDSERVEKSKAFESLAQQFRGDLREKALTNALVYARQGVDIELSRRVGELLLAEFPKSKIAASVQSDRAQELVREGRFREALALFRKLSGDRAQPNASKDQEAIQWNALLIGAHLEDLVVLRLDLSSQPSRDWVDQAKRFLQSYPNSSHRTALLRSYAFRRGIGQPELKALTKLPKLSADERMLLQRADWVQQWRASGKVPALMRLKAGDSQLKDPLVAELRSRIEFAEVEQQRLQFSRLRLDYAPQRFGSSLQSKVNQLEQIEGRYERIISLGFGPTALLSFERIADLYRNLARSIDAAPAAKEELAVFSGPLDQKALRFLRRCVDQGREFKVASIALSKCQSSVGQLDASLWPFTHEIFDQPRWIPRLTDESKLHPWVAAMLRAARSGQWGELTLAEALLSDGRERVTLDRLNQGVRDLTLGLAEWRLNQGEAAARYLRRSLGSGQDLVEFAAAKNLAALYLLVGDYEQVPDLLGSAVREDAEAAGLVGLAERGLDQTPKAIESFQAGLAREKNSPVLHFNLALALAANQKPRDAARVMTRYVELENPPPSHLSRKLLSEWRKLK